MKKYTLLISIALLIGCSGVDGKVSSRKLIDAPMKDNFDFAKQQFLNMSCYNEWYRDRKYYKEFNLLINMIEEGDEHAFRIGMIILRCMDGGNLSDMWKAFGTFYEKDPAVFFEVTSDKKMSNYELAKILTAPPWETVDNPALAVFIFSKRLNILLSIVDYMSPETHKYLIDELISRIDDNNQYSRYFTRECTKNCVNGIISLPKGEFDLCP